MGDKDFIRSTSLYEGMNQKDDKGNFLLAPLPYTDDHLEPYIGTRTVRFHYWKHIRAYIDKVNALKGKFPADTTIEKIIREEGNTHYGSPLYNNASQVFNHYFYFEQLNPKGANQPLPMMGSLIEEHYGTWEFEIPDNRGWYERIRFRLGIPHN
jgi:Fe-Mn family superoxide dismutase